MCDLVQKYYIDPNYLEQIHWSDAVRTEYRAKAASASWASGAGDALATEMVSLLNDKYSRFLVASKYAAIQKYDLIGVGVSLMPDNNGHIIVGSPPIPGSEAAKAGLVQGDWVMAINGVSTVDKTAFDIIDQIGENPNAPTITMHIQQQQPSPTSSNSNTERDVTMQRTFTKVNDPIAYRLDTRTDGTKVGVIKISEFNSLVKGNLERALGVLQDQHATAYVLDMRQNTGGAFQSAVEISGLFLPDSAVATYVVDGSGVQMPFRPPPLSSSEGQRKVSNTIPIVVWVDSRTASASEVLAGALQDNCRALVMGGTSSFGKGKIQAVYGLKENGAGLVLTVARYLTPSGNDIQGVGIRPDIQGPPGNGMLSLVLGMDDSAVSDIDFQNVQERLSMCRMKDNR